MRIQPDGANNANHSWMRLMVLLSLAALAFGCADREAQKNAKAQAEMLADTTIAVTVVRPERRDVIEALEVSGSLDSLDFVQVGAKVGGRLVRVSVRDGSAVRAGQVIAEVETTDLRLQVEQARAALQQALARRAEAELQVAMTPEQTEAAVRQAEAQLESAKARLDLARAGARAQEKEQAKARVNQTKAQLDKAKADLDRVRRLYEQEAVAKADLDAAQAIYDQALAGYQQAVEAYDLLLEGPARRRFAKPNKPYDRRRRHCVARERTARWTPFVAANSTRRRRRSPKRGRRCAWLNRDSPMRQSSLRSPDTFPASRPRWARWWRRERRSQPSSACKAFTSMLKSRRRTSCELKKGSG